MAELDYTKGRIYRDGVDYGIAKEDMTKPKVVDNLESYSKKDILSANQGRILDEKKIDVPEAFNAIPGTDMNGNMINYVSWLSYIIDEESKGSFHFDDMVYYRYMHYYKIADSYFAFPSRWDEIHDIWTHVGEITGVLAHFRCLWRETERYWPAISSENKYGCAGIQFRQFDQLVLIEYPSNKTVDLDTSDPNIQIKYLGRTDLYGDATQLGYIKP